MAGVKGYLHICAGCGKRGFVTAEEAEKEWMCGELRIPDGWHDYKLPRGRVSMCPECTERLAEACEELWKEKENER